MPGSPWRRAYIERVIGTIRPEYLDQMIVSNERTLRLYLSCYVAFDHQSRTHVGRHKDAPGPRLVQGPESGRVVAFSEVGGSAARSVRQKSETSCLASRRTSGSRNLVCVAR